MVFGGLTRPSLVTRIGVGKAIGLVFGAIGLLVLPQILPDADMQLRLGVFLWYPTMGAFIGVFGVMNWHPVLELPLPWWVRAPLIGAWMNLVLTLFMHETLGRVLEAVTGAALSPYWFVLEGAVVGGVIGWAATRLGGEGRETLAA